MTSPKFKKYTYSEIQKFAQSDAEFDDVFGGSPGKKNRLATLTSASNIKDYNKLYEIYKGKYLDEIMNGGSKYVSRPSRGVRGRRPGRGIHPSE